jgi:antitoxin component of RelBE/YafQ-DinJ toxin-antitoxin module
MDAIPITVSRVAKELSLPVDGLMQRSLRAYLTQEIRAVQMDMSDFQDRYGVAKATELRERIEQGKIYSHPAWEDVIEWETLEAHLAHLRELLPEVRDV